MRVIVTFRCRQRRTNTKYMCRNVDISQTGEYQLNVVSLFKYMMETNKQYFLNGLEIPSLKRLKIEVYKISYCSQLGLLSIKIPFYGRYSLPSFAKRSNKQYYIRFHAQYRVTTRHQQRPFYLTNQSKFRFRNKYF